MKKSISTTTKLMIICLCMVLCSEPLIALTITEVLYNPLGSDNNQEFIELAAAGQSNLTGWLIADTTSSDTLTLLQPFNSSFILIVEEGFNYTGINATVYSAGASIGNNLHNTHDTITLHAPNGSVMANMSYNQTLEGLSLVLRNTTYVPGKVIGGTPGRKNPVFLENRTVTNQTITSNLTTTTLNITCPEFSVATPKLVYANKERIQYNLTFSQEPLAFNITYWVDDLSGSTIRKQRTTHNTKQKSYTPSINLPEQALVIKARAISDGCDVYAEKLVVVRNPSVIFTHASSRTSISSSTKSTYTTKNTPSVPKINTPISYDLKDSIMTLIVNNTSLVNTTLTLQNNNAAHAFEVWSYVYRGSKTYSGTRESNKQRFVLGAHKTKKIILYNTANLTPGTYKLKVKIRKDAQKSTTDLTQDLIFLQDPQQMEESTKETNKLKPEIKQFTQRTIPLDHTGTPTTTWKDSFEPLHALPYVIIAALVVLALCLIWTVAL